MKPTHTPLRQHVIPYSRIFLLALGVLTAFGGAEETPHKGGTLRMGMTAEPSTLDMHWQPERTGQLIAGHYVKACTPKAKTTAGFPCWPKDIRSATMALCIRSSYAGASPSTTAKS
jgi:hypothetical protein